MKRRLPVSSELSDYLSKSEALGQYTNFGILHQELQQYIASRYNAHSLQVALASSATLALSLCVKYYQQRSALPDDFLVVMPSWTFAATAHSALFIGCQVAFVDTSESGILEPDYIRKLIGEGVIRDVGLVMPVIPFGRAYESKEWEEFFEATGIPVVIDCAAGFSSAKLSTIPAIVSTHATKYFPTGEGGFVLCADEELVACIKSSSNFGFKGSRSSFLLGTNAKLSEYHAAIGLAYKDGRLFDSCQLYRKQAEQYIRCLEKSPLRPFGNSIEVPVSTFNVQLPEMANENCIEIISGIMVARHGVEARKWWQSPLHMQPAFKQCQVAGRLDNTDALSRTVIGVPIGEHLDSSLIEYIVESLVLSYERASSLCE